MWTKNESRKLAVGLFAILAKFRAKKVVSFELNNIHLRMQILDPPMTDKVCFRRSSVLSKLAKITSCKFVAGLTVYDI